MAKSFYEVLGVPRTATDKEIRAAYRKLARKHHPDVNPNDRVAEARFKEINSAFEVLSDPGKRAKYDKYGAQWEQADQIEEMQRRQSAWGWAGGGPSTGTTGDAFGDLGTVFETLFRRDRGPRGPVRRRGRDIETPVQVTLEEAFRGSTRAVEARSGEPCSACGGLGEVAGATCHACGGTGTGGRPRRLEVTIPAGVKSGSRVRVAGEGGRGVGGGPSGDLYLVMTVTDHPRFERRGDNLYVDALVPLVDAVLGGEVEIATLEGRVALRLPELTQNGQQFRLAGKGMPVMGERTKRGDLFARVKVQLPEHLDAEERRLFEQLRGRRKAASTPA